MKHAYLILAHKNWNQLMTLLSLLDDCRNDIFLHIDRYASDVPFDRLRAAVNQSQLVFVKRIRCSWGDYSLVEAELLLLKEATKTPHVYYHLLSGQDLPLASQGEIHEFFEKNTGLEYVNYRSMGSDPELLLDKRFRYYSIFRRPVPHLKKDGITYFWMRRLQKYAPLVQKKLGVNRLKGMEGMIYYGSQWFSITDDFARYLLTQEDYIKKHFRLTTIPDEHFVQTVLMQSPFRERIASKDIRFVRWIPGTIAHKHGHPYVFTANDYDMLMSSGFLFARKFDETTDPEIISMIVRDINHCCCEELNAAGTQES